MRKVGVRVQFEELLHGGDYFPEQWVNHPEVIEEDIIRLKEVKANAVSIGMFAWSALEVKEGQYDFAWLDRVMDLMAENKIKVMLATPSGARPGWMSKNHPEVLRINSKREKMLHGGRHNHCYSSPYYRKKVREINQLLARRYKNHPALYLWHISNEYEGECHCDLCQNAFRDWLKEKYDHDLEKLNEAYWSKFWSHRFSDWEEIQSPSPIGMSDLHGLTLDWKRFVTHQTLDFYKEEKAALKEITGDLPVFTNFQSDNPGLFIFKELDYSKFADEMDLVAWNAYPEWHNDREETRDLAATVAFSADYFKSLKQKPFLITESTPSLVNWRKVNKAKRPGMHLLSSMQMLAHGSNSNMYFQVRQSRGGSEKFHGAIISHDRSNENRVYQEVKELGRIMEKISPDLVGTNRYADVGILYDTENAWALEDARAYGLKTKKYDETLISHYRTFWEKDIQVDVITPKQSFADYKLLIIPMLYMISDQMIERIEAYVKAGGHVLMTYLSAVVGSNDLVRIGNWPEKLQEIFGIEIIEIDTYYPKDKNTVNYHNNLYEVFDYATIVERSTAKELGTYLEDFYQGETALSENHYGKGKAYYLGARMEEVFQRDFYDDLIEELDLKAIIDVDHEPGVSVQGRINQATNEKIVFIMNFSEEEQVIKINEPLKDLLTAEKLEGKKTLEKYGWLIVKK